MKKQLISTLFIFLLLVSSVFADNSISYSNVKITETDDGGIATEFDLKNTGTDITQDFLVEIQPISPTESFFSFFAFLTDQKVCDEKNPDNVYRIVKGLLLPGATINVKLKTPPVKQDTYQIKAVSVNQCCNLGSCVATQPFGFGKLLSTITTTKGPKTVTCGDKNCSASENVKICPADCGPYFGDGVCSDGETYPNEPACVKPVVVPPVVPQPQIVPPVVPTTPTDSDGDGIIDSEDKCPNIQPIDSEGNKITNPDRLPKTINGKDNPLYGCPIIQINKNPPEILGDNKNSAGINVYGGNIYVPIKFQLLKDQNFDLTGLKIEAGIYDVNEPTLGGTFAVIPPEQVLGSSGLVLTNNCVQNEPNVQTTTLSFKDNKEFSTENKYDAMFIMSPKLGKTVLTPAQYAVAIRLYRNCGEPISANTKARVIITGDDLTYHNIMDGNNCITVAGVGKDLCSTPTPPPQQTIAETQSNCVNDLNCPSSEYCAEVLPSEFVEQAGGAIKLVVDTGACLSAAGVTALGFSALVGGPLNPLGVVVASGLLIGSCFVGGGISEFLLSEAGDVVDEKLTKNICLQKKYSLTVDEIKDSTPRNLLVSLCEKKSQCSQRENDEGINMPINCKSITSIEQENNFDVGIDEDTITKISNQGIVSAVFKQTNKIIFPVERPNGLCFADEPSVNIFQTIGEFFGLKGDNARNVGIGASVGGVLLVFFLLSGRK